MTNCEEMCDLTDIAYYKDNKETGEKEAVLWCEKYNKLCDDVTECEYYEKVLKFDNNKPYCNGDCDNCKYHEDFEIGKIGE